MADATTPWCFTKGDPLENIEPAKEAYLEKIDEYHVKMPEDEWERIVGPFNLTGELEKFKQKPNSPVYDSDWWELKDPVDSWGPHRNYASDNLEIDNPLNNISLLLLEFYVNLNSRSGTAADAEIFEKQKFLDFQSSSGLLITDNYSDAESMKIYSVEELADDIYPLLGEISEIVDLFEDSALYRSIASDFETMRSKVADSLSELEEVVNVYSSFCPTKDGFEQFYIDAMFALAAPEIAKENGTVLEAVKDAALGGIAAGFGLGGVYAGYTTYKSIFDPEGIKKLISKDEIAEQIREAFAESLPYSEQCMLLTFLPELLVSNKSKGIPYRTTTESNYPIKAQGDAFGFINRLVVDPSQKELFELKPSVVSQLTPYIRLYKVEKDKDGVDQEIPIVFDTNIAKDLGPANAITRQRGYGVGMNSFTFSYDGTDPFSAKKAISAKLSIFASTFQDLLKERGGFKYADLALKTGGASKNLDLDEIEKENLDKLNFRLKATVGWNVPRETFVGFSTAIKNAMYNSYITIYLTPTIHSFDFDETGAVTFDIDYLAYIEDAMTQRSFNIFANLAKEQSAMESLINAQKKMECAQGGEQFKKIKKVNEEFVSTINLNAYSNLVSKLAARDKIYYLNMTYDQVEEVLKNPDSDDIKFPKPYTNSMVSQTTADAIKSAASGSTGDGTNILSIAAVSQDNESIPYFYLEDLVAVAMDNIEKTLRQGSQDLTSTKYFEFLKEKKLYSGINKDVKRAISIEKIKFKNSLQQFQQTRVILGPIEIYSPSRKYASFKTTLGNIPISLNYFFEFMSEKVLSKEILNYPINKFVKDLVNDLIKNFLNSEGCTRVNNNQKLNINSTAITAYNRKGRDRNKWEPGKPPLDDISHFLISGGRPPEGPILLLNSKRDVPGTRPVEQMINYYVFSAGRKYPIGSYVGDKAHDEKFGIFHYILGRDKGIIKNISLEKTTAPGLKEVRFEQEGYNGLEQLREVYNVKVDSFLNVQTFPGTYIYVEPRGFSPSTTDDLTRYGIGGYHMITKTTHRIAPGDASTTINAAWVCSKEGDSVKNKKKKTKKREPEANEKINKCVVGVVDLGRLVTGFDGKDLTPEQRGKLGQELYEAAQEAGSNEGIYTV